MIACEDCRYNVRISDGAWQSLKASGKVPVALQKKCTFCGITANFVKSAILACSIKQGSEGQVDLSCFQGEKRWMPMNIISSETP